MIRFFAISLILLNAFFTVTVAAAESENKEWDSRLDGTWELERHHWGHERDVLGRKFFILNGVMCDVHAEGDELILYGYSVASNLNDSPHQMSIKPFGSEESMPGIYKVSKNKLVIVYGFERRPTSFEVADDPHLTMSSAAPQLLEFTRDTLRGRHPYGRVRQPKERNRSRDKTK